MNGGGNASSANIIDCHRLRVVSRLLGLKIRGEDLIEHIQHFDTEYAMIELVRKIESDRIYEPEEAFDGNVRERLPTDEDE